jgi:sugar phosphate permease
MAMGGGLSGIAAVFFAELVESYGWRDAVMVTAIAQLVLTLPFILSIRNRPQDLGLEVDGGAATEAESTAAARSDREGMTVREALRSSVFWRVSIAFGLASFATTALIVHQIPFLTESANMSETAAAASITALTVLSIIGRVGLGAATDFFAHKLVMALSLLCVGVSLALFTTVTSAWHLIYVLPLFAIGHGGLVPVRSTLQADYFGLRAFGSIQGLQLTVSTAGAFLGPVLAGYMYDTLENYRLAFLMLAVAPLAGVPLILSTSRPRWRDRDDETARVTPAVAG